MVRKLIPIIFLSIFSENAVAADKTVNLLAWSGIFDAKTIERFTAQTGIKVNYDNLAGDEFAEAKLLAGGSGYDVVGIAAHPFLPRLIKAGAIREIDPDKVPNLAGQNPELTGRFTAANYGRYTGLYDWGSTGIGLNVDLVEKFAPGAPRDSLALIFDPQHAAKLAKCGITFLDSPTDMVPLALAYLGLNPDSAAPADLERVAAVFDAVRPYVRKFDSVLYQTALADGDLCVAVGYSAAVRLARDAARETKPQRRIDYVIPREGGVQWMSGFVVPKDAPNSENADALINFLLTPQAQAELTTAVGLAPAVPASRQLLDRSFDQDELIFPGDETRKRLHYYTGSTDQQNQRALVALWRRVVTQ